MTYVHFVAKVALTISIGLCGVSLSAPSISCRAVRSVGGSRWRICLIPMGYCHQAESAAIRNSVSLCCTNASDLVGQRDESQDRRGSSLE